jgi:protein dithiol:quinone oxidoreductase
MLGFLRERRRPVTALLALACFLMFGYALYAQYHDHLQPCPLCIFQRIAVVGLGAALLVAAALPQRWRIPGNASVVLVALVGFAGMAVSGRHLYIQAQPPGTVPTCGAPLDYMWEVLPAAEVLRKVFTGSGECGHIDWTLLGLSMPGWVLIGLLVLTTVGVLANWRSKRTGWSRP